MISFNPHFIEPGMIVHPRTDTLLGTTVRKALNIHKPQPPCWGNHDGMFIECNGEWFIGDSQPMFATLTPIKEYEEKLTLGRWDVRVYIVATATRKQGIDAANYWLEHVQGSIYDFVAFPRLLFKAGVGDLSDSHIAWLKWIGDRACGIEWANWCTEGCMRSWKAAGKDPWQKSNPTPYTTEKRVGKTFIDVTSSALQTVV